MGKGTPMQLKKIVTGTVLGALVFAATAQTSYAALSSEQRLSDFAQLVNILQRNYGPLRWKKQSVGLDFAKHVEEYKARVAAARNDAEYYNLLARFTAGLKDAHVTAMIPSTQRSQLGFTTDLIEGKVLIETVDRLKLPEVLFPFNKGDQLISVGGKSVEQIMDDMMAVSDTGHINSSKRIAAARIPSRRQDRGFAIPKGVTTITVLPKGAAQPVTVTATWIVSGAPILDLDDLENMGEDTDAVPTSATNGKQLLAALKKLPEFNSALSKVQLEDLSQIGIADIGSPKSMFKLPANAKEIPGMPVTAAIYEVAGKKIGLVRIHQYMEEGLLEVIARCVFVMEKETDVLVIDQANNPGGSVSLVSDLVGLFADKSYKDMDFKIRPSLNWVTKFHDINEKIAKMLKDDPNDFAANALKARFDYLEGEIKDAMTSKRFLTNPVSLNLTGSFGMIQPNAQVRYTKPVLLLINEFDFSGGDAFPAIMKDNGRVTLFGAQTSGAGGNVAEHGSLANSGFKLQLTESLMVRPNGQFMENRGVKPDVAYEITEDDFMNDYRGYFKAFTVEALKLAGSSQQDIDAYKAAQ